MQKSSKRLSKKRSFQLFLKTLKKQTRGRMSVNSTNNLFLDRGCIGIKALKEGRLYKFQWEAMQKVWQRVVKKKIVSTYNRVTFQRSLTKKATGIRMGKGKGDIKQIASYIRRGQILVEFHLKKLSYFYLILRSLYKASKKSSIQIKLIWKVPFFSSHINI